jgi:plastocyanin domain-containing protein
MNKRFRKESVRLMALLLAMAGVVLCLLFSGNVTAQSRKVQTARVEIGQYGYEPVTISLRKGVPARITFLRKTDDTCATEVVFPDHGVRRALPLGQPVLISLTPRKAGEFSFTCGMNMHRGKLVVRQ